MSQTKKLLLTELVAATHTPFHPNGDLNLDAVEKQASHMLSAGVRTVFIGGSTGESHSLALEERRQLAERWMDVARGTELRVVVHVGSNCLADARALASQAEQLGVLAISALAPSYFKPRSLDALIDSAAEIAAAAPRTPFYFYDIPVLTGVNFSMPQFLAQAPKRITTLAGIKFTNPDLMAYQLCLRADGGKWDVLWGTDEYLLAALALGAKGAVGSTYNFAAPIYLRLMKAFAAGDLATAREEQFRSVRLIQALASYGYMGAAKSLMGMLGVPVGPARLPNGNLTSQQLAALRAELDQMGFFSWIY
jgi:N-acetylneuraminate lyase